MSYTVRLERDVNYGIHRRAGYSVTLNGYCVAELEPWLIVALWKAWWQWQAIRRSTSAKSTKNQQKKGQAQ